MDTLEVLESQQAVERHLQIKAIKPCATAYLNMKVSPEVGLRSRLFYALAAELRRIGTEEVPAAMILHSYYNKLPDLVKNTAGRDGRGFTPGEVKTAVASAYRHEAIKSFGCNNPIWAVSCLGKDDCHFYRNISKASKGQSRTAAHLSFLEWLGAKDKEGKSLLTGADIRVYLGLELVEKKRGFKPGSQLFVTWRELAELSGVTSRSVGNALINLHLNRLVDYKKGKAQQRGTASEVKRILPVPQPGGMQKLQGGV